MYISRKFNISKCKERLSRLPASTPIKKNEKKKGEKSVINFSTYEICPSTLIAQSPAAVY